MLKKMKKKCMDYLFLLLEMERYKSKYANISYSQEGEDVILSRFFEKKKKGFYIDVGAHHPKRFSNTFYFYQRGWRGINIDAMPGSMDLFKKMRHNDINIEAAVSDEEILLVYYMFNEPALNTFSVEDVERIKMLKRYSLIGEKKIKTSSLKKILDNLFQRESIDIDFMSIDVEGFDLKVLKSNDWERYRPSIVLVESRYQKKVLDVLSSDVFHYMDSIKYNFIAKTYNTLFFAKC